MLTTLDIMHGSMIIAEHMGGEISEAYPGDKSGSGYHVSFKKTAPWPSSSRHHALDSLEYHSNFNWIMSVVIKINQDGFKNSGMGSGVTITITSLACYSTDYATMERLVHTMVDNSGEIIDAIFETCWKTIEIIKSKKEEVSYVSADRDG